MNISFHLIGNDESLALAVDGQMVAGQKLNRVCGLLNEVVTVLRSTPPSFEPGFDPSEIGPYLVGQVSLKARSSALHDVVIEQPAIARINVRSQPEQRLVVGKDLGDGRQPVQILFDLMSWTDGVATYSASLPLAP